MAPKRRDNKGRILQMGEWQEPNGRYRYIYNDALGKRKIIYSWRLTEADPVPAHRRKDIPLREKALILRHYSILWDTLILQLP